MLKQLRTIKVDSKFKLLSCIDKSLVKKSCRSDSQKNKKKII